MLAGIVSSCFLMALPTLAATTTAPRSVPRGPIIIRCAPPLVEGSLDRGLIRRVIRAHKNELRACYEKGLLLHPTLTGRVLLRFQVEPGGQVQAVQVSGPPSFAHVEPPQKPWRCPAEAAAPFDVLPCLANVVASWRFPAYKTTRQTVTEVTYPIVFRSLEAETAAPARTNPYFSDEELAEMSAPACGERS